MNVLDNDRPRAADDLGVPADLTPTQVCCLDCGLPIHQCPAAFHRHPNTEPTDLAA